MILRLNSNKIIRFLIISDILFWLGWGLLGPLFPIFIINRIIGGSPLVAGISSAVFLIVRSLLRVPLGIFLDACTTEKDDYFILTLGLFLVAFIPLGFMVSTLPIHLYILQAIHGLGTAMLLSGWSSIFTRHINKGKESTEWGIDSTAVGFSAGIAGIVGGFLVTKFGFNIVFILVSLLGFLSTITLFALKDKIKGVFDNGLDIDFKNIFDWRDKENQSN